MEIDRMKDGPRPRPRLLVVVMESWVRNFLRSLASLSRVKSCAWYNYTHVS